MTTVDQTEREEDREIVTTRRIEAPPELVFRAWTDPRHLTRWFGPQGFTTTTHRFDFRPGGVWAFDMNGPDGTVYPNWIEWREIVPPERLHFRQGTSADDPDAFLTTVTFAADGAATVITLRALLNSREQRDYLAENFGAVEGAYETLERLATLVAEFVAAAS